MSERLIDERNRSLIGQLIDDLKRMQQHSKDDKGIYVGIGMAIEHANNLIRHHTAIDTKSPVCKQAKDECIQTGQPVGISDIRAALECAERLADDKGSDLQYSIIAKGVLALRSIEREVVLDENPSRSKGDHI